MQKAQSYPFITIQWRDNLFALFERFENITCKPFFGRHRRSRWYRWGIQVLLKCFRLKTQIGSWKIMHKDHNKAVHSAVQTTSNPSSQRRVCSTRLCQLNTLTIKYFKLYYLSRNCEIYWFAFVRMKFEKSSIKRWLVSVGKKRNRARER